MKRFSSFLAFALCCAASLAAPEQAQALTWDWVPRVLKFENPYKGLDASRYPGFECKLRNTWGDCIVFSYISGNSPSPQKNYYRRVSSFGDGQNYSDCQYDDYRRSTAPRTNYADCDYGEPRTYESR